LIIVGQENIELNIIVQGLKEEKMWRIIIGERRIQKLEK